MTMRNYRRGVIAIVLAMLVTLVIGVAAQGAFVGKKHWVEHDSHKGKIMKGTIKTRSFTATSYVNQTYTKAKTHRGYHRVNRIAAHINFAGTHMPCAGDGIWAVGYHSARIHWYFKDTHGRNFDKETFVPCESDTNTTKGWSINVSQPTLYPVASWKANWTLDIRGGKPDNEFTLSGKFRTTSK